MRGLSKEARKGIKRMSESDLERNLSEIVNELQKWANGRSHLEGSGLEGKIKWQIAFTDEIEKRNEEKEAHMRIKIPRIITTNRRKLNELKYVVKRIESSETSATKPVRPLKNPSGKDRLMPRQRRRK